MSSGRVHIATSLAAGIAVSVVVGSFYTWPGVLLLAGTVYGTYVSPDYDLLDDMNVRPMNRLVRRFGCWAKAWRLYWLPYGYMFSHRSRFTHSWPVGTLLRFLYGLWPALALFGVVLLFFPVTRNVTAYLAPVCLFAGQSVADATHLLFDRFYWR